MLQQITLEDTMKYIYIAIFLAVLLFASYAYTQIQTGTAIINTPIPAELKKYAR